jgi:hypothetical protein
VALASSSSELEAKRQLDKELAILHQELGMDPEPHDRLPAQDVPM